MKVHNFEGKINCGSFACASVQVNNILLFVFLDGLVLEGKMRC